MKIKTLHILTSRSWGGLESYALEFIHQHRETLDSTLFCYPQSKVHLKAKELNISCAHSLWPLLKNQWNLTITHYRADLWRSWLLSSVFKKTQKTIYHLMMGAGSTKKGFYHKFTYGHLSAVVSSSHKVVEEAQNNFPLLPHRIYYLPYGRNLDHFLQDHSVTAEKLRKSTGAHSNILVFGTACRLDRQKGVIELAKALEILSESERNQIQIWIIGQPTIQKSDGSHVTYESNSLTVVRELELLQEKFPKQLFLIPHQKDLAPYYVAMDIFVLATYNETYSLAVIEAMASGRPILGTNSGGTIEQVQPPKHGVLVTPKSSQSLAEGIRFFLRLPKNQRLSIGENAKKWALKTHSWHNNKQIFYQILKEIGL
ncbi:MAG: glycosyltransferase family 4 protein [Bdellovibrionaceae bacterium]|nr:glycosyltransferase family 4 protein [Pseudobdellovibrionaceae bacterium]MDW8190967.1 glycosyltransferase family 4 protein [Pseudobdellovibrionaceae bacterium]